LDSPCDHLQLHKDLHFISVHSRSQSFIWPYISATRTNPSFDHCTMELKFQIETPESYAIRLLSGSQNCLETAENGSDKGNLIELVKKPDQKARQSKGINKLSQRRSVLTPIPLDVWENILVFCGLDFLLKARSVHPSFKSVLGNERAWKAARLHQFGPDHPGPPSDLNEMQYADLIVGHGCQTKGCTTRARRTYWAYRRRWCERCLEKNTTKVDLLVLLWGNVLTSRR